MEGALGTASAVGRLCPCGFVSGPGICPGHREGCACGPSYGWLVFATCASGRGFRHQVRDRDGDAGGAGKNDAASATSSYDGDVSFSSKYQRARDGLLVGPPVIGGFTGHTVWDGVGCFGSTSPALSSRKSIYCEGFGIPKQRPPVLEDRMAGRRVYYCCHWTRGRSSGACRKGKKENISPEGRQCHRICAADDPARPPWKPIAFFCLGENEVRLDELGKEVPWDCW